METTFSTQTMSFQSLMSSGRYSIPKYQRQYSWSKYSEVADLWNDLSSANLNEPYFMGIVIVAKPGGDTSGNTLDIVDGQQRLISLSLLANAVRIISEQQGKKLLARSLQNSILHGIDYDTEHEIPRIILSDERDRESYESLISSGNEYAGAKVDRMRAVQQFLIDKIKESVQSGERSLAEWASFLSDNLSFAVFVNATHQSAFKIFEVVNARGKTLTPAEMIKAFLYGVSERSSEGGKTYKSWTSMEDQFRAAGGQYELTNFIRHVLILRHGPIRRRDLYSVVEEHYNDAEKVEDLFRFLAEYTELYLTLISPNESSSEVDEDFFLASHVAYELGLTTIRPLLLSIAKRRLGSSAYSRLFSTVIPRIVVGQFGTNIIEDVLSRAAMNCYSNQGDMDRVFGELESKRPARAEFVDKVRTRSMNPAVIEVLRNSILQQTKMPRLQGYLHYIRQSKGKGWDEFDAAQYRDIGKTIGNTILLNLESRPYGANTPERVSNKFAENISTGELVGVDELREWSASKVEELNEKLSSLAGQVWYD
jgi:uncharacterized protein with ParB-like and HNH nuclease domain